MSYQKEKHLFERKMSVNSKLLMWGGIVGSVVALMYTSLWLILGLVVTWLGYSNYKETNNYKNGNIIREIDSIDEFVPLSRKHLSNPDKLLSGEELEDFYEEYKDFKNDGLVPLKGKDITYHLAINTELAIEQFYKPKRLRELDQIKLDEVKDKLDRA